MVRPCNQCNGGVKVLVIRSNLCQNLHSVWLAINFFGIKTKLFGQILQLFGIIFCCCNFLSIFLIVLTRFT